MRPEVENRYLRTIPYFLGSMREMTHNLRETDQPFFMLNWRFAKRHPPIPLAIHEASYDHHHIAILPSRA
jgi:hypothetical protein